MTMVKLALQRLDAATKQIDALIEDMRAEINAHEQWMRSAEATPTEIANSRMFVEKIRKWLKILGG